MIILFAFLTDYGSGAKLNTGFVVSVLPTSYSVLLP